MGRSIMVDPQTLENAAKQMDNSTGNYKNNYTKLFNKVTELGSAWKGKDNQAFVKQIEGFRQDFENMKNLMNQYSDYLRKTASVYRKTQGSIADYARKL